MKLPGYAWLQFEALPRDGGGACLRQTAFFDPRGAFGFAYWYAALVFHEFIFNNMAKRIVLEAEQAKSSRGKPNIRVTSRPLTAGTAPRNGADRIDFAALYQERR
jgi:hypothetical protein